MAHSIYSRRVMVLSRHWRFAINNGRNQNKRTSKTCSQKCLVQSAPKQLTLLVPFALFVVEWLRFGWPVVTDAVDVELAVDADEDVVHSFTYSMPRCGVVCDFDGC